nr:putative reverse transcriptase and intron [Cryptomonas sp. NIES-345]BDA98384.1 putative reverse transcriptase and intron [Cryptomonas sp. NIES-1327]
MSKTIFNPSKPAQYNSIDQESTEKEIVKLQHRIHIASTEGKKRRVRDLQRLLVYKLSKQFILGKTVGCKINQVNELDKIYIETSKNWGEFKTIQDLPKNEKNVDERKTPYTKDKDLKLHRVSLIPNKIQETFWDLALIPAIKKIPRENIETQKHKNVGFFPIFLRKARRNLCNKWILKINGQKLLNDIKLGWILKNTPLEKSVLKTYLKHVKEKENKNHYTDKTCTNNTIISTIITHLLNLTENFLESEVKTNIELIQCRNEVTILSNNEKRLLIIREKLIQFLDLERKKSHLQIISTSKGFKVSEWNFYKLGNKIISRISKESLKNHKQNLKLIVKSNTKLPLMISRINALNNKWHLFNKGVSKFKRISKTISIYVFRLLWHWAKRRHSNKGNLWIFHNYWKKTQNKWRFIDKNSNQVLKYKEIP